MRKHLHTDVNIDVFDDEYNILSKFVFSFPFSWFFSSQEECYVGETLKLLCTSAFMETLVRDDIENQKEKNKNQKKGELSYF